MNILKKHRLILYLIIFFGSIIILNATFSTFSFIYKSVVLVPVSYVGFLILKITGIPIIFNSPTNITEFCEYQMQNAVLQVTYGCTGIFALFILISGIIAFPCSLRLKGIGILLSVPSFYLYSILRLVFIGIIGNFYPSFLNIFHSYVMEIVNIVFVLLIYIIWIGYVEKSAKAV